MPTSLRLSLVAVLVVGCRTETELGAVPDPGDEWSAALELDAESARAGESVGYRVEVSNRGEPVSAEWSVSSDREDALLYSLEDLTPIIAGEHTLSVEVRAEGWSGTLTAPLTVTAAAPYDLDLRLADAAAVAGDLVAYEVEAMDRYGNAVSADAAEVIGDSPALVVEGGEGPRGAVSSATPGVYLISATLDGLEDVEPLWVDAGPPASVDLTLSSMALRLGGTTSATVDVRDALGNPTWAAWTLSTDRPAATRVSGRNVTFYEEGWHSVTATLDLSGLSDTEGPLLIDDTGPEIEPGWPGRGEWTTAVTETVRGVVSDVWSSVTLTINDEGVAVGADGAYSLGVSLPWGVSVWEVVATDEAGNTSSDARAVLSGEFLPYGDRAPDAIRARLSEGAGGIGTLESLGEGLVNAQDLTSLIPNPVYQNSSQSCWRICAPWPFNNSCWEECITWYSVVLRVQNPRLGPADLQIDPRSDGRINLRMVMDNPQVDFSASGTVTGIGASTSGSIVADYIQVDILVRPRVAGGRLALDIESVNTTAVGFDFRWADWLQSVLNFFGFNADAYLAGLMEEAIDDAVRDALPPVLEDALNSFDLGYSFALGGAQIGVDASFSSVAVDNTGLTLGLGTQITTSAWSRPTYGLGSLYGVFTPPVASNTPRTQIGLSVDLLNQIAYTAWGVGLLDIEEPLGDLGIPEDELRLFLPGVTSLTAVIEPLLPPVVVPGTGAEDYDLQLGDMQLTLYSGPIANDDVLIQVYITAVAGLSVGAQGDDRLSAVVGNADFWFDVTVPESSTQAAGDTEALVGALVPLLLPRITDVFSEIAIPSFAGFAVSGVQVRFAGEQEAWVVVGGSLVEE